MPYTYSDYYSGRNLAGSQLGNRGMMNPQIEMLLRNAGLYSDFYQQQQNRTSGLGYMPAALRAQGQYAAAFRAAGGAGSSPSGQSWSQRPDFNAVYGDLGAMNTLPRAGSTATASATPSVSYTARSSSIPLYRPSGQRPSGPVRRPSQRPRPWAY